MGTYVPSGASLFLLQKFNSNLYTYVHNFSLLHVFLSMVLPPPLQVQTHPYLGAAPRRSSYLDQLPETHSPHSSQRGPERGNET